MQSDTGRMVFRLCGTQQQGQCPVVEMTSSEVIIRDDFGGQVKLTRAELELLLKHLAK